MHRVVGLVVSQSMWIALGVAAFVTAEGCVAVKTHSGSASADVPDASEGDGGAAVRTCESTLDCAGTSTPRCATALHRCVGCVESDGQCPESQFCDPLTHACRTGCRADVYCPQGTTSRCDLSTGRCVECSQDTQCVGRVCRRGRCEFACTNGAGCGDGTECAEQACIPRTGLIAELLLDRNLLNTVTGNLVSAVGTLSYVNARRSSTTGVMLRAASFTGDGRIDLSLPGLPTESGPLTFAMWVRTGSNAPMTLLDGGDAGARRISLRFVEGRVVVGAELDALPSPTPLTDQAWHHVAMTLGADGLMRLYVDGLMVNRSTFPVVFQTSARTVLHLVGRADVPGEGFVGALDDVRVYSRALSDDEIHALGSETLS